MNIEAWSGTDIGFWFGLLGWVIVGVSIVLKIGDLLGTMIDVPIEYFRAKVAEQRLRCAEYEEKMESLYDD